MLLGFPHYEAEELGGLQTGTEISGQPELWLKLWDKSKSILGDIKQFIRVASQQENIHIILTGAGTSSFIGNVLEGIFQISTGICTKSVATTDLVTHPELYFSKSKPVLLISFARSGDSPESSKVIELAESLSKEVYHLVITCNENGELIRQVSNTNHFAYYMPAEANDKSLAMTGSFTSMLLGGLIVARINQPEKLEEQIYIIKKYADKILDNYNNELKKISEYNIERAVFLGSGLFSGIAEESHLKLQELTDGKVICKHDTFLGFRHGPKAVVDENTLVVCLFSNNVYVNKYEIDLVNALKEGRKSLCTIGVMEKDLELDLDLNIVLSDNGCKAEEEFLAVVSVIPAQMLGFFKSIHLGLHPDSPSASGMIHRVVQGVNIYPYIKNGIK